MSLGSILVPGLAHASRDALIGSLVPRRAFRSFHRVTAGGLPQHSIQALAQDRDGVLWIATFDGVATFDGSRLRSVRAGPESPWSGPYYALVRRRGGGLYAGGIRGVHVFRDGTWRLWPTPGTVAALVERKSLWMMDQAGRVWRRARGSRAGWKPQPLPGGLGAAVGLAAGPGDDLWVAGAGGVARFGSSGRAEMLGKDLPAKPTTILVSRSGTTWVGTDSGQIFWYRPDRSGWTRADTRSPRTRIRTLAEDRRGRIWAGGAGGMVLFGREKGSWTRWGPVNGLNASAVSAILADREGTVWFGSVTDGLQQWIGEAWSHGTGSHGRPILISGIAAASGGGFLVAAYDRGVWHWDGSRLRIYDARSGLTEDARFAVSPRPGVIWVGTRFGIFESVGGAPFRRTLRLKSGIVTGISVTGFFRSPGGVWYAVSSSEGIFRHEAAGWKVAASLNRQLPDLNVRSMMWRANGELWVASLGGVTVFANGRGLKLPPDAATGIPRLAQTVLEVRGEVWVGAFGGIGIWRRGRWNVLTERDGLPGKTIYSLRGAPNGVVWAGGSSGVGRYAKGQWTVWDTHNGLLSNECNVNALWIAPGGEVLVGTVGSLARFDPSVAPLPAPELRLQWGALPGEERDGVRRLRSDQRSIRVTWRAPWLRPEGVQYRTRVARLSKKWSTPRSLAELNLASLGPGRWDVEVAARVARREAAPWTASARLRLLVEPYFWETAWAWLVYVLVGLGCAAVLVRFRTRRLIRRAAALQRGIDERVAQIRILRGLLPICAVCKKIRDDQGYWKRIESYLAEHSEAELTHGFCPECFQEHLPPRPPKPGH